MSGKGVCISLLRSVLFVYCTTIKLKKYPYWLITDFFFLAPLKSSSPRNARHNTINTLGDIWDNPTVSYNKMDRVKHPVQNLFDRVSQLEADKERLLELIEGEGEAHRLRVAALKERIGGLEVHEAGLLERHKSLLQESAKTALPVLPGAPSDQETLLQALGAVGGVGGAGGLGVGGGGVGDAPAPLAVGHEVRVRDSETEDWKYGVVAQYSGAIPMVRLNGWTKLLQWNFIEARPL